MSLIEAALAYASQGWRVFPLDPGTKRPFPGSNGFHDATCDAERVTAIWSARPDAWVGVWCRGSGFVAFDVDPRNGGDRTLAALEAKLGPLPRDVVQRSQNGGWHILVEDPSPGDDGWTRVGGEIRGKMDRLGCGKGVDVKCNGYIVVEPSGAYRWEKLGELPPMPDAWIAAVRKTTEEVGAPDGTGLEAWQHPSDVAPLPAADRERLRDELRALGPRASGKSTTYAAIMRVHHDYGLSIDDGYPFVVEWNAACGSPRDERELHRQITNIAEKAPSEGRGHRRSDLSDYERIARAPSTIAMPAPAPSTSVSAPVVADAMVEILRIDNSTPEGQKQVAELLDQIAIAVRPPVRTYQTPYENLNRLLGGGIKTRQLAVVVAPPGDGKSAMMVDLALRIEAATGSSKPSPAFPEGYPLGLPVLYASTELEREELLARFAANVLDVPWTKIVTGEVPPDQVARAIAGRRIRVLGCDQIPLDGPGALVLIYESAAQMATQYGVAPFVVVDYLQDLARDGAEEEKKRVGNMATKFRAMAQLGDCPVVCVSAVSRAYYGIQKQEAMRQSEDPRVYMAAAKESGNVDYAAATIVFLDVGNARTTEAGEVISADGRPARLCVAKARHGTPGFAGARFFGASGRWTSDPEAIDEVVNQGARNPARAEKKQREDAEMITEVARKHLPTWHTKEQLKAIAPGWGKMRAEVAVGKAIELGLLVAINATRIEAHKPRQRTGLFPSDCVPKLDRMGVPIFGPESEAVPDKPHPAVVPMLTDRILQGEDN